jgi:hypothetical protein
MQPKDNQPDFDVRVSTGVKDSEKIYDEQVAPLMSKVVTICIENDIPMLATFQLTPGVQNAENPRGGLFCTSRVSVPGESKCISAAHRILDLHESQIAMVRVDPSSDIGRSLIERLGAQPSKPKPPNDVN